MQRARHRRRDRDSGGFTLIELSVVVFIVAVTIAIAGIEFGANAGTTVAANDRQAQALAIQGANAGAALFSQTNSYRCSDPNDLNNMHYAVVSASAPMLPWVNTGADCVNVGSATPNKIAVVSWSGINNTDTSTTFAVTSNNNPRSCWFVIKHSEGPDVFGYRAGDCTGKQIWWPTGAAPNLTGAVQPGDTLQEGTFPNDPNL